MKITVLTENSQGTENCLFEHGLSLYIETKKHKLVLDMGATDTAIKNAETLGIDLSAVDTVVLSHGHYDHTGGLMDFCEINRTAKVYIRSTAFGDFYHRLDDFEKYIGVDKRITKLQQLILTENSLEIDDELFLFSGIKGQRLHPSGNATLMRKTADGFTSDDFDHEQCLVIKQEGKQILLSGCAHNGILNILDSYREIFGKSPDIAISGFHLMKPEEYTADEIDAIKSIAHALSETDTIYFTGHCTSLTAFDIMKPIMDDKLIAMHSGDRLI